MVMNAMDKLAYVLNLLPKLTVGVPYLHLLKSKDYFKDFVANK